MILSGDRNIGTSPALGQAAGGAMLTGPQAFVGTTVTGGANPYAAWTASDLHLKTGNLGLTDGSVQTTTVAAEQSAFITATNNFTGNPANTIYYNFTLNP
jgi:hypothetical protein